MSRSAFLPETNQLRGLLLGLHARPVPPPVKPPSSGQYRTLDTDPPPTSPRRAAEKRELPAVIVPTQQPLLATRPPEPEARQVAVADGDSLDERFRAFAAWAREATGAVSVFVTDREGLSMVPSTATEDYLAVAAEIAAAQRKLSLLLPTVEGGSTQLELLASPLRGVRWIELVSCATNFGEFTIGLLLSEQLGVGLTTRLRAALRSYLAEDPGKSR